MLSVGIDTHQNLHQIEVQNHDRKVMWRGSIKNNRKGFNDLLSKLKTLEESNNDTVRGIYINPTGTYHVPIQHFLETNGYDVFYVDARITDSARTISNLGKEKSDKVDAHLLASTPWISEKPDKKPHLRDGVSELTRLLQIVKRNVTRITNMILSDLACVFPEYTEFFPDISSKTSLAILERYTTPEKVLKAGEENLYSIMKKSSRNHYGKEDAWKLYNLAKDSIGIPDTMQYYEFRIRENIKRLIAEIQSVHDIEEKITHDTENNEDARNIGEMKGIGPVSAAAIVSEIGNISQFDSALKLQSYGGKVPMMTGSGGKSRAMGISRIRNPYLSNTVHECAVSLVMHKNEEFVDIFNREISKGKKPTQAYTVVGRRLLYHVYSMMKNHKPYRERRPMGGGGLVSTVRAG